METTPTSPSLSFILRLSQAGDEEQSQWCATLIDPQTGERLEFGDGERLGFGDLEVMAKFLRARMEALTYPKTGDPDDADHPSDPCAVNLIRGMWPFPQLVVCC